MKDEILRVLTMEDILNKYGIKVKRGMFNCAFHGDDKHASAKSYDKSFYCFTCNKTGDLIQFVQHLFNLSFKEAMQKINEDFNLGLDSNIKVDYKKIKAIEDKKKIEKQIKEKKNLEYLKLCQRRCEIENKINEFQKNLNILNWEINEYLSSSLKIQLELIDERLDEIFEEL